MYRPRAVCGPPAAPRTGQTSVDSPDILRCPLMVVSHRNSTARHVCLALLLTTVYVISRAEKDDANYKLSAVYGFGIEISV